MIWLLNMIWFNVISLKHLSTTNNLKQLFYMSSKRTIAFAKKMGIYGSFIDIATCSLCLLDTCVVS